MRWLRRQAEQLRERRQRLEEEQALLGKYREMLDAFAGLFEAGHLPGSVRAYHVILRPGQAAVVEPLREALAEALDSAFELRTRTLSGGDTALLLLVPLSRTARVEHLLTESGVQEVPLPAGYEKATAAEALPRMRARLQALPALVDTLESERKSQAETAGGLLPPILTTTQDAISRLEAVGLSASTRTAFIVEGWVPAPDLEPLTEKLRQRIGPEISVEELPPGPDVDAPVILQNPRLFRPFQLLVEMLPLPTYGSIDPTPFVAVFFPVFFGLMLGDIGYGVVLLGLGAFLARRARPGHAPEVRGPDLPRLRRVHHHLRRAVRRAVRGSGSPPPRAPSAGARPRGAGGHRLLPHPLRGHRRGARPPRAGAGSLQRASTDTDIGARRWGEGCRR